ncbi:MAG: pilus assembly protein TadG-related protein [Pseudomonadota bacterium]
MTGETRPFRPAAIRWAAHRAVAAWRRSCAAFGRATEASITVWNLSWSIVFMILAGLAVDVSNAYRMQTLLQSTADAAALAAIIDLPDTSAATLAANDYAELNLAPALHGDVLAVTDIRYGVWDAAAGQFTNPGAPDIDAVEVILRRSTDNNNTLPTTFLRLIGFDYWNIVSTSVATNHERPCMRNGMITERRVIVMAYTTFSDGICVHGQDGVTIADDAVFTSGARPSMVDSDDLLSAGNPLDPSVEPIEGWLQPKMAWETRIITAGVLAVDPDFVPSYIDTTRPVVNLTVADLSAPLEEGRVFFVACTTGNPAVLPPGTDWRRVAVVFDCPVSGADVLLQDVMIVTDQGPVDFTGTSRIGRNDSCTLGGGVQIIARGDVRMLDDTRLYGVQIVSRAGVELAGLAGETEGVSIQAGNDIILDEADLLGVCQGGVDTLDTGKQYRLVD